VTDATFLEYVVFFSAAVMILGGAIGVIIMKNPVHAALGLVLTLFGVAVQFVAQQAHFLAAVQVIVYAGAIVVLFLFVIMLIGSDTRLLGARGRSRHIATIIAVIAGVAFIATVAYVSMAGALATLDGPVPGQGSVQVIGEALFTQYLLPFELASVLLLVAMIGAVVLARKPKGDTL